MTVGFPVTEGLLEPFGYGQGYPDWIFPANPGANTNLAVVVDARNWIRVIAVIATITTDANVANRWVSVDFITAQGKTYLRNGGGFVETATNGGKVYAWSEQRTDSASIAGGSAVLPVSSIFLAPGTTVQITVDGKQAGDTITAAVLTVERWDTGPTGYPIGFTAPSPADFV
jgi:hypothetical protein